MNLNFAAVDLLDQLKSVIKQLKPKEYTLPISTLSDVSIGQHVRHSLEFFVCLIDAKNNKVLNYDNRKRDQYIEQEGIFAISILESIQEFIAKETTNFSISLEANYTLGQEVLTRIDTSFFREVAYNIEHTIHHMALIKIGVKALKSNIILPDHFGVATSTVRYYQNS